MASRIIPLVARGIGLGIGLGIAGLKAAVVMVGTTRLGSKVISKAIPPKTDPLLCFLGHAQRGTVYRRPNLVRNKVATLRPGLVYSAAISPYSGPRVLREIMEESPDQDIALVAAQRKNALVEDIIALLKRLIPAGDRRISFDLGKQITEVLRARVDLGRRRQGLADDVGTILNALEAHNFVARVQLDLLLMMEIRGLV